MIFQDYYGPYEFTTALRTEPIKEEIEDDEDPVQISHEEEPKKKVAKVKRKISGGSAVYPCRYCPLVLPKENRRVAHESQHTGEVCCCHILLRNSTIKADFSLTESV